ncbi:serine/threonine protein kinase, putative [Trypanosoma brucei gambiense DAL972]|uniref:non-specific serine/threonine protein kinase n=1 Tax=Trypanosoma brucei gambiense (strain MHOM/CI/86/DAL972) TaxID=679716 RepID=C9ZKY9_TRYB9|nr:LOW QUALITY PROTEIN: serine/threonine protein kinase, putative [Trypanosoma brucei gambiense DAL972]CBH09997.1 serine/threonine protein kinase, putative [Trypanosoma brucei gambiense DAL972]|eukprot:XP_011772288.1 LOW QUALITY PROTEIN: serine/threonine protein kinase, putative [Trypanosoma brucei gambiense DAL972]
MAQVADECKALSSELFLSKYRIMKGIGKGSFGEAVLVRSKEDGKRYVAKAIESAAMSAKEKRDVQNEIRILAAANHPNIIRYHEHFEDGTLIFIVMEYADGKILGGQYEPIPSTVPAEIRGLCGALLQVNPVQRPSINRILESPFVQESLKGFSADLEKQAEKERAEYEARNPKITKPVKPVSTPEKPKEYPKEPQLSQKEQMAKLRGMNRESIKAMLAEQAAAGPPQEQQQQSPSQSEHDDGHHEVDDDGEYIEQKKLIVEQSKNIVGKTNLGGHPEEFGDGPSDSSPQEDMIILSSGKSVPASQVRAILEKEIGVKLLNEAAELVNQLMLNNEISNVDIQKQLNELLGAQHAHHSNAITKLCVYEGKKM